MAYPAPFHRLVIIGNLYTDTFNTTLSMIPTGGTVPAVTQALADLVASEISEWWALTISGTAPFGPSISPQAILTEIKLNRIGTDGKYMDAVPVGKVLATPVPGGGTSTFPPPQLSLVATLRGANERAAAGRGRMFFPPTTLTTSNLGSDGRVTVANATNYANAVGDLLDRINGAYFTETVGAVTGIASRSGAGAFQAVTKVTVGRVVDTMRSRRNKLPEDPQEAVF